MLRACTLRMSAHHHHRPQPESRSGRVSVIHSLIRNWSRSCDGGDGGAWSLGGTVWVDMFDRQAGTPVSYEKSLFGKSLLEPNIPAFFPDYIAYLIQASKLEDLE